MSNASPNRLFVYGSLRSGFRSPAYEYISRYFNLIGEGKVGGKLYDMGSYPAGLPSDDGSYIIGELYAIRNEDEFAWAIGQLDDYEGVTVDFDEVQLYHRGKCQVKINGQEKEAWIYWYHGPVEGREVIPSGDILEYLKTKR